MQETACSYIVAMPQISWASNGFDGDHAAGEASRMQCVKWQT